MSKIMRAWRLRAVAAAAAMAAAGVVPASGQTGGGAAASGAAPAAGARMVQPESLEQGFIIVVEDKARLAGPSSPIFLASSHNGWNPGDVNQRLSPRSDSKWQIELPKPTLDSRLAFKFARGSWETVAVNADYSETDNWMLPLVDVSTLEPGEKPVIEFVIEAWADQRPNQPARLQFDTYRPITVSAGTLRRVEVTGGAYPVVRDVLVWLPPGYGDAANRDRRYPVIYMQDGQNLFEKLPTTPGEWGVDETVARLVSEGKMEPVIVVGIPSLGNRRASEYLPFAVEELRDVEPRAGEYVEFVVNEVMPRVERAFRVKTGPEHTAIGGASLGALVSLEAAARRPDVFGKVLAESASFGLSRGAGLEHFAKVAEWNQRVYIGMGGRETGVMDGGGNAELDAKYVAAARAFNEMLASKNVPTERRLLVIEPEAVHNEPAWAARLPKALEFLFPAGGSGSAAAN